MSIRWLRRRLRALHIIVVGAIGQIGLLTVDGCWVLNGWLQAASPEWRIAVLIDGRDITNCCAAADDRRGWALVYREHPVTGQPYVVDDRVASDLLTGVVRFTLARGLPL